MGLERDVKKTAQCAVFSPRRDSNRVSGAKKGVRNACARRVAEQVPSTAPKKMTCTFIVQVFFFCKGVRDLNGTLRKQHSALFLVPGVIATALAAQKKAQNRLRP